MEKHAGSAKRSVMIKTSVETVWKKLSNITKLVVLNVYKQLSKLGSFYFYEILL